MLKLIISIGRRRVKNENVYGLVIMIINIIYLKYNIKMEAWV